jgi:hypothetical protein
MLILEDPGALVRELEVTREEEIPCDGCFAELDRFVEMGFAGLDAGSAMPLVRDHLEGCGDCREEYQALLRALDAQPGPTPARTIWARTIWARTIWARLRRLFRTDREPS